MTVLILGSLLGGVAWAYGSRNTSRITIANGGSAIVVVEVAMQRLGRPKSFPMERNLPVSCRVRADSDNTSGISVSVLDTSHTVHHLRARVQVRSLRLEDGGRAEFDLEFTIAGRSDWPKAKLTVNVDP